MSQQAVAAVAGGLSRDRRDADTAGTRSRTSSHSTAEDPRLRVSPRLSVSPLISPRPMMTPYTKPYQLPQDLGPLAETFSFHTLSTRSHEPLPPLKDGATTRERLAYIGRQLDLFGCRDLLLQKFRVLGEDERRGGGAPPPLSLPPPPLVPELGLSREPIPHAVRACVQCHTDVWCDAWRRVRLAWCVGGMPGQPPNTVHLNETIACFRCDIRFLQRSRRLRDVAPL